MTRLGYRQRKWYQVLKNEGKLNNPCLDLTGKAQDYSSSYFKSIKKVIAILESEGYTFTYTPGKNGGMYGGLGITINCNKV